MNYIALAQSIQGRTLVVGGDSSEREPEFNVYRNIDLVDVYHVSNCDFFLDYPGNDRMHIRRQKVGEFYHPHLLLGMPCVGGDVKLHVDTRFPGWYVLWAGVQTDNFAWGSEPREERCWDVVAWTPKVKGDSVQKASYRLIKALVLQMDYVDDGEWTTNMYQNDNWEQNWYGTENVMEIMREIRGV